MLWNQVPLNFIGDEIIYEIHNKELRLRDSRYLPIISQYFSSDNHTLMAFDIREEKRRILPTFPGYLNME